MNKEIETDADYQSYCLYMTNDVIIGYHGKFDGTYPVIRFMNIHTNKIFDFKYTCTNTTSSVCGMFDLKRRFFRLMPNDKGINQTPYNKEFYGIVLFFIYKNQLCAISFENEEKMFALSPNEARKRYVNNTLHVHAYDLETFTEKQHAYVRLPDLSQNNHCSIDSHIYPYFFQLKSFHDNGLILYISSYQHMMLDCDIFKFETLDNYLPIDWFDYTKSYKSYPFCKGNSYRLYNTQTGENTLYDNYKLVPIYTSNLTQNLLFWNKDKIEVVQMELINRPEMCAPSSTYKLLLKVSDVIITYSSMFDTYIGSVSLSLLGPDTIIKTIEKLYEILDSAVKQTNSNVKLISEVLDEKIIKLTFDINMIFFHEKICVNLIKEITDELDVMNRKINYLMDRDGNI